MLVDGFFNKTPKQFHLFSKTGHNKKEQARGGIENEKRIIATRIDVFLFIYDSYNWCLCS